MDPDRWQRLQALFDAALERPPPEREAFLAEACPDDAALRDEAAALIRASEGDHGTLERSVAGAAREAGQGTGELDAGDRVGPYLIVREIGRGGMGAVYLASREDDVWRKHVAIKVVRGGLGSTSIRERFLRERRILARLEHPYIARVLDGGQTPDGLPWLAMEYVEGEPLDRFCETRALRVEERLRLFERVCEAVQYAHRNLVVHRDLKPGNVLVQPDGTPRLLDFGIARLLEPDPAEDPASTITSLKVMTPSYASPEQLRGDPVTTASDVYSMGVILYELLSGRLPYRVDPRAPGAIERAIVEQDPDPPSVAAAAGPGGDRTRHLRARLAGDLDAITLKALRKEPERRYESVAALAEDVRRHLEGLPVGARRGTWRYRSARFVRRHRAGVAAAAAVLLAVSAAAIVLAVQAGRLAAERDRANQEAETAREVAKFLAGVFEVSNPDKGRADQITARELLDRGSQRIRSELGDRLLVRARLLTTIGATYRTLGLYDSAQAHIDEALAIREKTLNPFNPEIAASLHERGLLRLDRGRLAEAREDYERAISIREAALGPDHPDFGHSVLQLGLLLSRMEKADTSLGLLERAYGVFERAHGPDHPDAALALSSLAVLHARQDRLDLADSLQQRVLAIRERTYGPEHPRVAEVLNNLGALALRRGNPADARPHLARAHGLFERTMGPEHPHTLGTLANLATAVQRSGDLEEARALQERCLMLEERALGPNHPNVAFDCINLANTLRKLKEQEKAWPLLQRAHGILTRSFGPASPPVARLEVDLAEIHLERGQRHEARRLATRARLALEAAGRTHEAAFERAGAILAATES